MNAISLLRAQLEGSFELVRQAADETSVDEWSEKVSRAELQPER